MDESAIRELFNKANVQLARTDVWSVQGTPVVKHKALERLAGALKISFTEPQILRAERDEAVILVRGNLFDTADERRHLSEWSIGEACVNVNYLVKGKMAAYVYAMAEKRAKDRVILKLAGLHGVYSEEEADEFKSNGETPPAPMSDTYLKLALSVVEMAKTARDLEIWWVAETKKRNDMLDDLQRQALKNAVASKGNELKAKENDHAI